MITNGRDRSERLRDDAGVAFILELLKTPERITQLRESVGHLHQRLDAQDAAIRDGVGSIEPKADRAAQGIEAMYERLECLNAANEQRSRLTEQFFEESLLQPLVRRLFPLVDLVSTIGAPGTGRRPDDELLAVFHSELLVLLASYGIEPLNAKPMERVDLRLMRPAGTRQAPDPALDMTVAESLRIGFRRGERVLRPQSVLVYRWTPDLANDNQGGVS